MKQKDLHIKQWIGNHKSLGFDGVFAVCFLAQVMVLQREHSGLHNLIPSAIGSVILLTLIVSSLHFLYVLCVLGGLFNWDEVKPFPMKLLVHAWIITLIAFLVLGTVLFLNGTSW